MSAWLTDWGNELPTLARGLLTSVELTAVGLSAGLLLGLLLALGSSAPTKPTRWLTLTVVELGRGTPMLVVLELVYFGLPQVNLDLSGFAAAVVAIALITGAYTSEIFRAGLDAVPFAQREASQAVGLRPLDQLRYVILPQGIRIATPPLLSFGIQIFQATSLAFVIAVPEIISKAYSIGANTFLYLQVFTLTALLYAAVSVPAAFGVRQLEGRLGRHLA
jgi:polar amino acid transport system permease protein